jgi:FkbM family methyltransferase
MIEANTEKEDILKQIGNYKIALLGSEDNKEVDYYKCKDGIPTGNSIYKENTTFTFEPEKRKSITLPTLLGSNNGFDLIKMDVQGSELDIIKGALPIIKNTKYLLLELQTYSYNKGAPQIEEVISYLHNLNFGFIDLFDLMYSNNHLIQVDGLFINRNIK